MQIRESITMAFSAIKVNKLRSILTLLGISVGVFSIIGVMTAMGVLQNAIETGLSELGTNTFQIQKFPNFNIGGGDVRSKFRNRKDITIEQGEELAERLSSAKYVGLEVWYGGKQVVYKEEKTNPNVGVVGETPASFPTNNWTIQDGRVFTEDEVESGKFVCVLGDAVVDKLFPFGNPVGEEIKIDNHLFKVIGTIEKKGAALGGNQGNFVAIPITTAMQLYGKERSINIMVQTITKETYEDAIELARGIMRIVRNVAPGEDDDFYIFSNETMVQQFNEFTFMVKLGTLGISCIALIAAGVGIMNIMLVSVTERTKEIGIRKALGATKRNVLSQFLTESVVFSQIGGIIGILGGSILGNVVSLILSAPPIFPWNNTVAIIQTPLMNFTALQMNFFTILFCSFIGIIFGVYPAWKASNLDPIEALRYE